MYLGDYEFVGPEEEVVNSVELENLHTEIARLKAENRELKRKMDRLLGFSPI